MEPVPVGTGWGSHQMGYLTCGLEGQCERWQYRSGVEVADSVVKERTGPLTWGRALPGVEAATVALARRSSGRR